MVLIQRYGLRVAGVCLSFGFCLQRRLVVQGLGLSMVVGCLGFGVEF